MLASLQNNCVKAETSYKQLLQKLATQGNASNIPGLSVPGATVAPVTTNYPTTTTYPTTATTGVTAGMAAGVTASKLSEIGNFPSLSSVNSIGYDFPSA